MREVLLAADAFDDLVHGAKLVPMTAQVQIDLGAYSAAVERMRASAAWITERERGRSHRPVSELLESLDRLGAESRKMPLSSRRRMDKEELYDLVDRFRIAVGPLVTQQRRDTEPPP